jgi:hypothetical protein
MSFSKYESTQHAKHNRFIRASEAKRRLLTEGAFDETGSQTQQLENVWKGKANAVYRIANRPGVVPPKRWMVFVSR